MQYILSEEEYTALKQQKHHSITLSNKKLAALCTKIANEMPVNWGWNGPDPKPWGCIHTQEDGNWYCDSCPVQDICPQPRSYSK